MQFVHMLSYKWLSYNIMSDIKLWWQRLLVTLLVPDSIIMHLFCMPQIYILVNLEYTQSPDYHNFWNQAVWYYRKILEVELLYNYRNQYNQQFGFKSFSWPPSLSSSQWHVHGFRYLCWVMPQVADCTGYIPRWWCTHLVQLWLLISTRNGWSQAVLPI